jgi:hypothetical protein
LSHSPKFSFRSLKLNIVDLLKARAWPSGALGKDPFLGLSQLLKVTCLCVLSSHQPSIFTSSAVWLLLLSLCLILRTLGNALGASDNQAHPGPALLHKIFHSMTYENPFAT